ncbi:hypothetical protein O988_08416 [Pseudogymnoascus sp. VKM F-3808]|nr:hypothetical protein O988_08416 [Pseudogymnoascus sp. VKM F-3808]
MHRLSNGSSIGYIPTARRSMEVSVDASVGAGAGADEGVESQANMELAVTTAVKNWIDAENGLSKYEELLDGVSKIFHSSQASPARILSALDIKSLRFIVWR